MTHNESSVRSHDRSFSAHHLNDSKRMSQYYVPTRKEDPAEAEVESHKLLVRGGYIRMIARGIYSFLPLGWRTVRKIENIVREEMVAAGAIEVHMPMVQPAELWIESGRWGQYGTELLRLKDRKGGDFCLGPTHEEVITSLVRGEISSYKQLPINLFQIQTKFRDEARPRFGLMRGREFIMKDAYSFDLDEEGALLSYDKMYNAYRKICDRIGFDYRAVEADSGNIGGSRSHEFQVLAKTGEDEIASCHSCGYAANVEKAKIKINVPEISSKNQGNSKKKLVDTPNVHSIEELSDFLNIRPEETVKTLLFSVNETDTLAVLMRGDHTVNEVKLLNYLNKIRKDRFESDNKNHSGKCNVYQPVTTLELADDATVEKLTGAPVGFAGPIGLDNVDIIADYALYDMDNMVVGANQKDKHYTNVVRDIDFEITHYTDLRQAKEGDPCAKCGGSFQIDRGIEIGHVFYLGTKYSSSMGATILDEHGVPSPIEMGCYGIGITRIMAAAIEQANQVHDESSASVMVWPIAIAPFHVEILTLQSNKDDVVAVGDRLYDELNQAGFDVLYDDRDLRAGHKFNDADLIGAPFRILIGSRGVKNGVIELKTMKDGATKEIPIEEVAKVLVESVSK